jgi:hypothetical protein
MHRNDRARDDRAHALTALTALIVILRAALLR